MSLPYTSKQRQETAIKVKQLQSEERLCQRKLQLLRKRALDLEQIQLQAVSAGAGAAALVTQQPQNVQPGGGIRRTLNEPAGSALPREVSRQPGVQGEGLVPQPSSLAVGSTAHIGQQGLLPPFKRRQSGVSSNFSNPVPTRSEPEQMGSVGGGQEVGVNAQVKDRDKEREKRLQIPWQMCSTILKNLLKHKDIQPFTKPVDEVESQAPDYYQVIKKPMDLGTISEKLMSPRQYTSPLEFRDDVRQVWQNCRIYNQPGSWIRLLGEKLSDQFEKAWVSKGVEERWFQETGEVDEKNLQSKMGKLAQEYRQRMENLRKSASKSNRKESTEFEERRKLSVALASLAGEKLTDILNLIAELETDHDSDGPNVEIDISQLKVTTVEQLRNWVQRVHNGKNKPRGIHQRPTHTNASTAAINGDVSQLSTTGYVAMNYGTQQKEQMLKQGAEINRKQQQQGAHHLNAQNVSQLSQPNRTSPQINMPNEQSITRSLPNVTQHVSSIHYNRHSTGSDSAPNSLTTENDVRHVVNQLVNDSVKQQLQQEEVQQRVKNLNVSDSNYDDYQLNQQQQQLHQQNKRPFEQQCMYENNAGEQNNNNKRQKSSELTENADEGGEVDRGEVFHTQQQQQQYKQQEMEDGDDVWDHWKSREEILYEEQQDKGVISNQEQFETTQQNNAMNDNVERHENGQQQQDEFDEQNDSDVDMKQQEVLVNNLEEI